MRPTLKTIAEYLARETDGKNSGPLALAREVLDNAGRYSRRLIRRPAFRNRRQPTENK